MIKQNNRIYYILITLVFAFCATTNINTALFKNTYKSDLERFNGYLSDVSNLLEEEEHIYKSIDKYIKDKNTEPYPKIRSNISGMHTIIHNLTVEYRNLAGLKNKVENTKNQLRPYTPESQDYEKLKLKNTEIKESLTAHLEKFNRLKDTTKALRTTTGIYEADITEINKVVYNYIRNVDQAINEIETGIANNRKRLATADPKKLSEKKKQEMTGILNQLEGIKNVVAQKRYQIENLINECKREAGDKKQVWAGPGMRIFTITNDIQQIGNDIYNLNMQFKNVLRLFDIIENKK